MYMSPDLSPEGLRYFTLLWIIGRTPSPILITYHIYVWEAHDFPILSSFSSLWQRKNVARDQCDRGQACGAGNYRNGAEYVGILFLTFWILLSYLVPLSLFVTMEIVKFVLVITALWC